MGTLEVNALSQAKTILNSSEVISWSRVSEDWQGDRPMVRVKLKLYSAMLLEQPGDIVQLIRKLRSSIPKTYAVEISMKMVV